MPQELRNAKIVHIYKRKGNHAVCDNHRGISLLSIAGKILCRVMLNRLNEQLVDHVIPESQYGFRRGRGTTDLVFTMWQIQEKCREQGKNLYITFVDLTKAFDTVNREALWTVLRKLDAPISS